MAKTELTLKTIEHAVKQLKRINGATYVTITELAKELKVKKIPVLDFIDDNPNNFVIGQLKKPKGRENPLVVMEAYLDSSDNPRNTDEYVKKRKNEFSKTLHISAYDNYGNISGYYIKPSTEGELKSKYLNTKEKVNSIRERFNLKPASYYIGGFGDSSLIKPEDGWEISIDHLKTLKDEGWELTKSGWEWPEKLLK